VRGTPRGPKRGGIAARDTVQLDIEGSVAAGEPRRYPSTVFCNQCGHRNPPGSNFCSSCGAALNLGSGDDTTVTIVLNSDATELDEDLTVSLDELPEGVGMLVVRKGPNAGSKYVLDAEVTRAGRHPDSDIFLDDITVSRRHAEITRQSDRYTLRDVGSLNGTYVNRDRVEEAALSNGDELQIGKFKLVFFSGGGR
jgi:FHA domain/zinc-ribbon domain